MGWRERIAALLGLSAYVAADPRAMDLDAPQVKRARTARGGQLQPLPMSQLRWYQRDLESAEAAADTGDLSRAARLMRSARKDGIYAGVLSTRTGGLVRLPKRFRGDKEMIAALELGHEHARSVFDEMFPATELAKMAADGLELGVAIGELVPVAGRDYPVLVRLDPEFLRFSWEDGRWYFRSIIGEIAVTPGDGRWVLHTPGGRTAPWQAGLWRAIGRAFIRKEHASLHKDNWEAKLANPARVATAPQGASEEQKQSWFRRVMAWGINTVFGMTPGYDVKLLESNGRGYESFNKTITEQNDELKMAVAGQLVTSDGGAGFQNSDIHKSIRADLIKETADALAFTINTQGIPAFVVSRFGLEALDRAPVVEWDVTPPKDRNSEATALTAVAGAMKSLTEALAQHGRVLDAGELADRFGVPVVADAKAQRGALADVARAIELARGAKLRPTTASIRAILEGAGFELEEIPEGTDDTPPRLELAPTDVAKVVMAGEARRSQGLPPFGDERDKKTITQLGEKAEADAEIDVEEATGDEPQQEAA